MQSVRRFERRYRYDHDDGDHVELTRLLRSLPARVMISGYSSRLYEEHVSDWRSISLQANNQSCAATQKVWFNFEPDRIHRARFARRNSTHRQTVKRREALRGDAARRASGSLGGDHGGGSGGMSGIDPSDPEAVRRRLDGLRSEFAGLGSGSGLLRGAAALFREVFRLAEEVAKNSALRDRLARSERQRYGRRSEKHPDIGGGSDGAAPPDAGEDEPEAERKPQGGVKRRKKDRGDAVSGTVLRFGPERR